MTRPLNPRERTPVLLQYEAGWAPEPIWTVPAEIKYTASYGNLNLVLKSTCVQKQSRPKLSHISFLSTFPSSYSSSSSFSSSITSLLLLEVGPQLTRFFTKVTRLSSTLTYKKGSWTNSNLVLTRHIPNNRTLKWGWVHVNDEKVQVPKSSTSTQDSTVERKPCIPLQPCYST